MMEKSYKFTKKFAFKELRERHDEIEVQVQILAMER